ncbi:amidohydrolase family protein [Streptomyces sp. NPDC019224]|uniref:amidohydrolase family protein n=1 Tax=Streptomyces sp. NPDC019224 TaxID=3154484 RepID=UPI0034081EA0
MNRVDAHAHVFHRGLPMAPGRRYTPRHDATVDTYLSVLDAHGIARALLVQPSFLGTDNGYVLDAVRARPDRFRAVLVVDAADPRAAAARVPRWHRAGARGIRLNLVGTGVPPLHAADWRLLGECMAEYGWHLEVQAREQQWTRLTGALTSWPSAVVLDHVGLPASPLAADRAAILDLAAQPHIWTKLSGFYRSPEGAAEATATAIREQAGTGRLLWGSDWPWTQHEAGRSYDKLLATLHDLLPDPEDVEHVLSGNPARLLDWN